MSESFRYKTGDKVMYCGPEDYLKGSSGVIDSLYTSNGRNMVKYCYGLNNRYVDYVPEDHLAKWLKLENSSVNDKLDELTEEVKQLKEKVESLLPKEKPKTIFVSVEDVKIGDVIYNRGETAIVSGIEHSRSGKTNTPIVKITLNKKIWRVYSLYTDYTDNNYKMADSMWFRYGLKASKVME